MGQIVIVAAWRHIGSGEIIAGHSDAYSAIMDRWVDSPKARLRDVAENAISQQDVTPAAHSKQRQASVATPEVDFVVVLHLVSFMQAMTIRRSPG
jgi:hypothetical protein